MTLKHLRAIMNRLSREMGYEEPSLTKISRKTRDPFRVLISCVLSLRTRDETTRQASRRLFALAKTPGSMCKLSPAALEKAIYPVGFFRNKARSILAICDILVEAHKGKVPDSLEGLLELPGVGRKTANIVMVYGFGKPGLPIDIHCHRIPNRIGWIDTRSPEETEQVLRAELPKRYWMTFNDLFVQFGQNVCKPIGPRCDECVIEKYCMKRGVKRKRK
jgi:endonuclease-3